MLHLNTVIHLYPMIKIPNNLMMVTEVGMSGVSGSRSDLRLAWQLLLTASMVAFASHAAAQQTERTQLDANGSVVLDTIVVEDTRETATGPVNGYIAGRSATATKTDTPLIETPRSVSVIPREQIVDQGAQSVAQALRYSAGVVSETRPTNRRYDSVFMRGFGGGGTQAAYINYLDGLKLQRGISYAILY